MEAGSLPRNHKLAKWCYIEEDDVMSLCSENSLNIIWKVLLEFSFNDTVKAVVLCVC